MTVTVINIGTTSYMPLTKGFPLINTGYIIASNDGGVVVGVASALPTFQMQALCLMCVVGTYKCALKNGNHFPNLDSKNKKDTVCNWQEAGTGYVMHDIMQKHP